MKFTVDTPNGVTLVGGGRYTESDLEQALALAPVLVAADGGANGLCASGRAPAHVIGDLDSIDPELRDRLGDRVLHVPDQDCTDFDKCLSRISAPFIIGLGFDGARLDHTLAAMTSLVWHGRARVVLYCADDICFLAPPRIGLELEPGHRVSLFPMAAVTGRSTGLHWPINGINFSPSETIGTSNRADQARVDLEFDVPGMLVLLDRVYLEQVITRLPAGPDWR
ncbi:MAG: thiamine diphosphokinase [Natronohydrobacter sp.]|nr:thiamine diphosphokinase [Natronohydrobacter sp.]